MLKDVQSLSVRRLLIIFFILLAVDVLLATSVARLDDSVITHLNGDAALRNDIVSAVIMSLFLGFPLICLLIAALLALFIYRHLPYLQRLLRIFLFILIIFYALMALSSAIKLVMIISN